MTSTIQYTSSVSNYGIHWTSDGVAFLEQGGPKGGANALGLRDKSPFRVTTRKECNHLIPLAAPNLNEAHIRFFNKLMKDPLVQAMMPLPKPQGASGMWYVEQTDQAMIYIALLSRMSSPIRSTIHPIWSMKLPAILDELGRTNVQPLVLSNIEPKDTHTVSQLAQLTFNLPRRLILTGDRTVPLPQMVMRIETQITNYNLQDLIVLPWEVQGATTVKRYMRGENVSA